MPACCAAPHSAVTPLTKARALLLLAALLSAAPFAHAQAPAEKLKKIEREVEQRKARAAELVKQREDLSREMDSLRGDLTQSAAQVRAREQELSDAERGLNFRAAVFRQS